MHTCLIKMIISLHAVVLFFVIIECANKYMCRCNNGESSKLPNARGTTVRYHGCVACLEDTYYRTFNMADENTSLRGDRPIQVKYRSMEEIFYGQTWAKALTFVSSCCA